MNNRYANSQKPQSNTQPGNVRQAKGPTKKRSLLLPILLIAVGCVVFLFAAWSAVRSPVLASIINSKSSSNSTQFQQQAPGQSYAQVYIPKPTYTPVVGSVAQEIVPTVQIQPTVTLTEAPQADLSVVPSTNDTSTVDAAPTDPAVADVALQPSSTEAPAATFDSGSTGGVVQAEIVPDTPTPEFVQPTEDATYVQPQDVVGNGEHWFDVDLSSQRMYAYEGDTLVRTFIVSTGTWQTPTVTGRFKVWIKLRSAPMSGPGYYLPDVPYIMYFYKDYGIHGTYWHNNFGVPMSHGCVNLSIPDAEWAYNFASVGTVVNVHD